MADLGENTFKPIETQEELNNLIKDRLKRERESTEKRFEGYISPEDHAKALAESNKAFDDYTRYNYMDNVLRGGKPISLPGGHTFYVYSRKHGDLERDYN